MVPKKEIYIRLLFPLLWVAYFSVSCIAQTTNNIGSPFIRNYLPKEYNAGSQNWTVTQDHRGILYFGNNFGVLKYNGYDWQTIRATNESAVRAISIDADSTIYVGANSEFGYLGVDSVGQMKYFSLLGKLLPEERKFNEIQKIFTTAQGVYFVTSNKTFRYWDDTVEIINLKLASRFGDMVYNKIFVINATNGISVLENSEVMQLPHTEIFNRDCGRIAILPYRDQQIMIITENKGVYVYDVNYILSENSDEFSENKEVPLTIIRKLNSEIDDYIKSNQIYSYISIDSTTNAIGTIHGGIVFFTSDGKLLKIINTNRGLHDNAIYSLWKDFGDNLWATTNNGISQIEISSPISKFTQENGIESTVYNAIKFKGKLYAGTGQGVYYLDDYKLNINDDKSQFKPVENYKAGTFSFFVFQNQLLCNGALGITQIHDNKSRIIYPDEKQVYCFATSKQYPNYLFIGLPDGLKILEIKSESGSPASSENVPLKVVNTIRIEGLNEILNNITTDNKNNFWISTPYRGILHLQFLSEDFRHFTLTRYDVNSGLPELNHNIAHFINNQLIVTTYHGIYRALFDSNNLTKLVHFELDNTYGTLATDSVRVDQILQESERTYWIHSKIGLGLLTKSPDGSALFSTIPLIKISENAIFNMVFDDEKILWLCSNEGLFRFDPHTKKNYFSEFNTLITKVIVPKDSVIFYGNFVNPASLRNNHYTRTTNIQPANTNAIINYAQNSLTFEFTATFFETEAPNQFCYYLEGFDAEWSDWALSNKKEYTNLPAGKYIFHVKSRNIFGTESSETSFRFIIKTPFYRTILAYTLYIIALVLLLQLGFRLNSNRLKRANERLEKLVAERTSEIQRQKEEIMVQTEQLEAANRELEKLSIVASETDNAVFIADAEGNFLWINDGFQRLYNYNLEEFIAERGRNVVEGSTNPEIKSIFESCVTTKNSVNYESFTSSRSGKKIWLQTTLTPICNSEGKITQIVAIESDISRLKEAEHEIMQQKEEILAQAELLEVNNRELEKLSLVASKTDNAVMIMDPYGNFEWVNDAFMRMFGLNFEQLLMYSKNIVGPNTSLEIQEIIRQCIEKKETVTYEFFSTTLGKKNIWLHATLTPILDNEHNIIKLIAIDSDISTVKEAENAIKEQNLQIANQREILLLQNEEIVKQRNILSQQKQLLESQNEDTKASIRYALTIQKSILPIKEQMEKLFKSFIMYRPKDIVSGDFYWVMHEKATVSNPDKVFVAVVDCTGHGVPGAFMSIIGSRLLNEIVHEKRIYQPNLIIELLDIGVRKALRQDQTDNNDGMDVCLCMLEKNAAGQSKVTFAGANRPLYLFKHATSEIGLFKGQKRWIGGARIELQDKEFVNQEIMVQAGDVIYLTTDGIADQNAPTGKKMGTKKLMELLRVAGHLPLEEQKLNIEHELAEHQKDTEQRDDMTLIGIQF